MISRMFFAVVGLGAGVAVGVWTIRKVESAGRQLAPDALVARAGQRAGGLGDRLGTAVEVGRAAAAAREAELRAQFLDGKPPAVDPSASSSSSGER